MALCLVSLKDKNIMGKSGRGAGGGGEAGFLDKSFEDSIVGLFPGHYLRKYHYLV